MSAKHSSKKVVYAALFGNLAIAITKFIAAAFTGSSAMISEGVHSTVDTVNELLLLHGMRRSAKPPDERHPFGYGRELYFWSFVVSLLVFALGAGVSIYEGVTHLMEPEPIEQALINYLVLGAAIVFEGTSWFIALRTFRASKGERGYFAAFRHSKDASTFTVLFEDSAALLGLLIALAGVAAAQLTGIAAFDGIASIGIGCVLAVTSMLLARETKGLLIGEPAADPVRDAILRIAAEDPGVRCANGVLTVHMGPAEVIAALSAEFEDALDTTGIEACIHRIEARVKQHYPQVSMLFIKPQTAQTWQERIEQVRSAAR